MAAHRCFAVVFDQIVAGGSINVCHFLNRQLGGCLMTDNRAYGLNHPRGSPYLV